MDTAMPRHIKYLFYLALMAIVAMASGCSTFISGAAADLIYTPASHVTPLNRQTILLASSDERPDHYVALNTNISTPILSQVNITIDRPGLAVPSDSTEKLVSPGRAAELAVGAQLNSLGHPVYTQESHQDKNAWQLVVYVYAFDVDFSEKSFVVANVTLALGKAAAGNVKKAFSPLPSLNTDVAYAPICAQSSGLGYASTLEGKNGIRIAGDALSDALANAVNTLNIKGCLQ